MRTTKIIVSEHDIQNVIIQYLTTVGWFVWRNNSGMMFGEYKGKKWATKMGTPGLPDLFAVKDNYPLVGIEVKRPGKEATPIQAAIHEDLKRHGVAVLVAHSLEEVQRYIKIL